MMRAPWRRVAGIALFAMACGMGSAQAIRVEAEDAALEGATLKVVPQATSEDAPNLRHGYSGKGYVTGFDARDSRLVFHVQAPVAGVYDLRIRYGAGAHKGYTFSVNGLTMSASFDPVAGGVFASQEAGKVELNAGANTVAIGRGWGFFDIDFIELTPSEPAPALVRPGSSPVDWRATPGARDLLERVDQAYGHAAMLGVYDDRDAAYTLETTGLRPAIMGGDLSPYSPASVEHGSHSQEIERLLKCAAEGYTVTLSWHWVAPSGLLDTMLPDPRGGKPIDARWYKGFYTIATTFDLAAAMNDPSSKDYTLLLRDIDAIAVELRKLDGAGVPILWRPLHEAEGKWFWWGAKGPKPFIALWRMMYDRLVNVDGVHNLVWVYTSGGDPAWYPGDDVVDVVGIDAYPEDLRDPQLGLWDQLQTQFAGRKPLAISEFGGVPDIPRMARLGARWAYAVSWSGDLGPRKNPPDELRRIYSSDTTLKLSGIAGLPTTGGGPKP